MPRPPLHPAPALVLFDIDGTLLRRSGPHHRQALVDAVRRVTGLPASIDGIPVQGMLDRDILTEMMRREGASGPRIRAWMPRIITLAPSIFVRRCPSLTAKVCPGVRALLKSLASRSIPAGLVTGNLRRIGWKKLERAGLKPWFLFGVFSEQAPTRAALARLAIRQARRAGWIDRNSVVALVGDHPNDILAARANNARAIAVATGLSSPAELLAHRPDHLLADLREFRFEMLR